MTSNEIRQSFLDFFKSKNHKIVDSAPVIPHGDPTLLFTNAGMNQFKDIFLGFGTRDYRRAADTQKCIRVSGKHNDLEEVGVDTYHHTFFEMLGNWSFNDYYKEEAIQWAWELLTDVWKLDKKRLHATVYRTDDESYKIWTKYLPVANIHRFDEKDNFWEMGETGPCGPCSEIHYDRTIDFSGAPLVNAGTPDVIEIWNLVFIQYNRIASGELQPLAAKHVDTGMGFERICAVIQKKYSNYDTDVFMPLINKIVELSGVEYNGKLKDKNSIAMRVIADHIRTLTFAIADAALPSNEGRGYVLRRILRRGVRFARNLGFNEPILYKLVPVLIDNFSNVFPEIKSNFELITKVIKSEEENFLNTLDRGLTKFDEISSNLINNTISGQDAFLLYDTYGFPLDLTELIARERNIKVDTEDFNNYMNAQKQRSRAARKNQTLENDFPQINENTQFIGYDTYQTEAKIIYAKDNLVVTDITPFYVESGGQISDTGLITIEGIKYNVIDTKKLGNTIFHILDIDIETSTKVCYLEIDTNRRKRIMRNHSATHLLHEALRTVLGNHVQQAGSYVGPDYLRFDFNHFEKPTTEQLNQIEKLTNSKIFENIGVSVKELALDEAKNNSKIKMFFGDKYGDNVRVITMDPNYSMELCGGTHIANTAEIGMLKITSESSIAAGVRRIEAITGDSIQNYINEQLNLINSKDLELNQLNNKIHSLTKELSEYKNKNILENTLIDIANANKINGITILTQKIDDIELDKMRDLADDIRNKVAKELILLLITQNEDKLHLVCAVTDDIKQKYNAGQIISKAAKSIGGNGGGKPHLATAGAKEISKIDYLIVEFEKIIKEI